MLESKKGAELIQLLEQLRELHRSYGKRSDFERVLESFPCIDLGFSELVFLKYNSYEVVIQCKDVLSPPTVRTHQYLKFLCPHPNMGHAYQDYMSKVIDAVELEYYYSGADLHLITMESELDELITYEKSPQKYFVVVSRSNDFVMSNYPALPC